MNNIKSSFTINDLENISGIKAHTIRIWEKRYNILEPTRASRDIRYYDILSLQKILNIALLISQNFKISKIANLNNEELLDKVKATNQSFSESNYINQLKMAMYSFDTNLFESTYQEAYKEKSFSTIFQEIFIPLLNFIGLYWQTQTISSAHEHFITNLIYQKIQLNIEKLKPNINQNINKIFVLFLPQEEMHEIGLLYMQYELMLKGMKTIYFGRSVPLKDLEPIKSINDEICFVVAFTMNPIQQTIEDYLASVKIFLNKTKHTFYGVGLPFNKIQNKSISTKIKLFENIPQLLTNI